MFKWIVTASENAQRKNISRTLTLLLSTAAAADARILQTGALTSSDQTKIQSLQKALLWDIVGPLSLDQLRDEYLEPIIADGAVGEGAKMAVRHVFDTASKR